MPTPLPTQDSLLESLKRDQDRFELLVSRLSEQQQAQPIGPEGWSVKDFLAHMADWKGATNAVLVAYTHDQPLPPETPSGDEANAQRRQQDAGRSLQDVHAYWLKQHKHLVHLLADELDNTRLAEEVRPPWGGEESPLCATIAEICEHDREHFLFIERLIEAAKQ